jgi:hypothetical protein
MTKKNIYSGANFEEIKLELDKALSELALLPIEKATDEKEERTGINGMKTPFIISSIEDKLKTAMVVINDSTEQLKVIYNEEGMTDFVSRKLYIIKAKLDQIQEYYKSRTYSEIKHRFYIETVTKFTSKGPKDIEIKLPAATKEDQVKTRSNIQKQILRVIPILNQIGSSTEEILIKGDKEIPLSLR